MSLAITNTRSTVGINARPICVEVHLSNGLPNFTIVGLPETAVKESKDRVRSAILNSQFEFPCRKIVVNLAPANLPKTGSGFDLPIAIGILAASAQIPATMLDSHEFIGELALNGQLRGVSGIIPIALAVYLSQKTLIIANSNIEEASLIAYDQIYAVANLREVCAYLCKTITLNPIPKNLQPIRNDSILDWSDIKGQQHAKNAMEIAAAGGHSLLLSGPPGSGKTMLAKRFVTLLPDLSEQQALESAAIYSIQGRISTMNNWKQPPFRSPHHTASNIALVGGGSPPKPGEISLAHNGVLFLDELPEFSKQVLETLREPLESGHICISRAAIQVEYPAKFQLIAAMNPCPCGQWGNPKAQCVCSPDRIQRYLNKLSAPLLDRIDIYLHVQALTEKELIAPHSTICNESNIVREKIQQVQRYQIDRQACLNASLNEKQCEKFCQLGVDETNFLHQLLYKFKWSARSFNRLLKVARTIADFQYADKVKINDLKHAIAFKNSMQPPK